MRRHSPLVIVLISVVLHGCTIAYFDLRDKMQGPATGMASCDVKYSINVTSGYYTNTFGVQKDNSKRLQEMKESYIAATSEVLNEQGCKATYVKTNDEATLEINIEHLAYISALPQEWLTGLSFGLIPSWGTRKSEYAYSFNDKITGKSHVYTVDSKSYNHLALFPVFWINFFTLDQSTVYKRALSNFLMHSLPQTPSKEGRRSNLQIVVCCFDI